MAECDFEGSSSTANAGTSQKLNDIVGSSVNQPAFIRVNRLRQLLIRPISL